MSDEAYYIVHEGSNTWFSLDECKILCVDNNNSACILALEGFDIETAISLANDVYSEDQITLG